MNLSRISWPILVLFFLPMSLLRDAGARKQSPPNALAAEGFLAALAGTWQFRMYSADRTTPITSGERVMDETNDSTKLAWRETIVDQADFGTGILGYNAATGAYYMLGVYTHRPNPVVLVGRLDSSFRSITFDPAANLGLARPGIFTPSVLQLIDENRFEWRAADGSWRAVFIRVSSPIRRF